MPVVGTVLVTNVSCSTATDIGDVVDERESISNKFGDETGDEKRLRDVNEFSELERDMSSAVVDCSGGTRLFSPPPPVVRIL